MLNEIPFHSITEEHIRGLVGKYENLRLEFKQILKFGKYGGKATQEQVADRNES